MRGWGRRNKERKGSLSRVRHAETYLSLVLHESAVTNRQPGKILPFIVAPFGLAILHPRQPAATAPLATFIRDCSFAALCMLSIIPHDITIASNEVSFAIGQRTSRGSLRWWFVNCSDVLYTRRWIYKSIIWFMMWQTGDEKTIRFLSKKSLIVWFKWCCYCVKRILYDQSAAS